MQLHELLNNKTQMAKLFDLDNPDDRYLFFADNLNSFQATSFSNDVINQLTNSLYDLLYDFEDDEQSPQDMQFVLEDQINHIKNWLTNYREKYDKLDNQTIHQIEKQPELTMQEFNQLIAEEPSNIEEQLKQIDQFLSIQNLVTGYDAMQAEYYQWLLPQLQTVKGAL